MALNQIALAKARDAILNIEYDSEDDALAIAITTYLSENAETQETHEAGPREADDKRRSKGAYKFYQAYWHDKKAPFEFHVLRDRWLKVFDKAAEIFGSDNVSLKLENAVLKAENVALKEALTGLENANEALVACRSHATYISMIDNDKSVQQLQNLDAARQSARAALTAGNANIESQKETVQVRVPVYMTQGAGGYRIDWAQNEDGSQTNYMAGVPRSYFSHYITSEFPARHIKVHGKVG